MNKLRLTFKKYGAAKYISHLDLLRTFTRALSRAKIPVLYSQGFNPHAQLTFALPLSVGVTSEAEMVDVSLCGEIDLMTATRRINDALPLGLEVISVQLTDSKMPKVSRAEYVVTVENEFEITEALKKQIMDALSLKEILAEKKGKKETKSVNILPHIHEFDIIETDNNMITFRMELSAGGDFNLKPELVLEGLAKHASLLRPQFISVHRMVLGVHST